MTRLITLQKKAIRIINKAKYNSHTDPLFKKLNLLKIEDIYKMHCIKIFSNSRQGILPSYLTEQLLTNESFHNYNTRQITNIHNLPIKTKLEEQTLNMKISKVWNSLPEDIKTQALSRSSTAYIKRKFISHYQQLCYIPNCYICSC